MKTIRVLLLLAVLPHRLAPPVTALTTPPALPVTSAAELRDQVLARRTPLRDLRVAPPPPISASVAAPPSATLHALRARVTSGRRSKTKPTRRAPGDGATIGLAIEGGGMRATTAAGMLAALAVLDLSDAFDSVYGSSGGAICGAYFVSRQVAVDVLTRVLVAARERFVNKLALYRLVATAALDAVVSGLQQRLATDKAERAGFENERRVGAIGMNTTYVLADIMAPGGGLRELDAATFSANHRVQPLRVVASYATADTVGSTVLTDFDAVAHGITNDMDSGLFRALQASMTVPGVAGAPSTNITNGALLFDAFCCEPIPYRSAARECTHVLVLQTRPRQTNVTLTNGLYDDLLAPQYFSRFNCDLMVKYHRAGGQLFTYAEDILLMNEAYSNPHKRFKIPVGSFANDFFIGKPPSTSEQEFTSAYLHTIAVEGDEMSPLEQDPLKVNTAFRDGFIAGYNTLAPVQSVEISDEWNGEVAYKILFGDSCVRKEDFDTILSDAKFFPGFSIFNSTTVMASNTRLRKRGRVRRAINSFLLKFRIRARVMAARTPTASNPFPGLRADGRWDAFLGELKYV